MHSFSNFKLMRAVVLAGVAMFGVAAPAGAQNWEASHQLRAGMFIQGGHTTFNGSSGINSESKTVGATGFGAF